MRILIIGGTDQADDIRLVALRGAPNRDEVHVRNDFNQWTRTTYDNISRIEVYGGDGDADISTDRQLMIPVRLYGGNGDDKLTGGGANDYLQGDAGADRGRSPGRLRQCGHPGCGDHLGRVPGGRTEGPHL